MRYFIHPIPLAAVALLVLNDRYLKYAYPSWVTGKISDFAGVFFMPLFICAVVQSFEGSVKERKAGEPHLNRKYLIGTIIAVDLFFIALKLWPDFMLAYTAIYSWVGIKVGVVQDPWDLLALSMNFATYFFARKYFTAR